MRTPRKPLFQARHFYWIAREVPKACLLAGCTVEQTRRVVELMTERLHDTNDLFSSGKFRAECKRTIWEVLHEKEVRSN